MTILNRCKRVVVRTVAGGEVQVRVVKVRKEGGGKRKKVDSVSNLLVKIVIN